MTNSEQPAPNPQQAVIAMNALTAGIITVDHASRILFMNQAAETITGWTLAEALHKQSKEVFKIINAVTRQTDWDPLRASLEDDESYSLLPNSVLIRKDGVEIAVEDSTSPIHSEDGTVTGAAILFRDISLSQLSLMKALRRADHDPLTSLPNRAVLDERLKQMLISPQRRKHRLAVLFIDLDGFKLVNDENGHATGDLVLQILSKRMNRCIRASDTLCRAGGDEFIVLLPEIEKAENAGQIAGKLLATAAKPILAHGRSISVSLSIGLAMCDDWPISSPALITQADSAMYQAKRSGGNTAVWFASAMKEAPRERTSIADEVRNALEHGHFTLHYQAQVDLHTLKIKGAEALLRWTTLDGEVLPPSSVIPTAERNGLIVPIGQMVLREALRQQAAWRKIGLPEFAMSVNVSPVELSHQSYLSALNTILAETDYVPGHLTFELTETVLLQAEGGRNLLSALAHKGICLAIDDFGVGHSTLNYLRRFNVDVIKIDRAFVENITLNSQDAALVRAIVNLGRNLKKLVIAEGVETEEQYEFLKGLGCHQAQGYLFSRPLPADSFELLLKGSSESKFIAA